MSNETELAALKTARNSGVLTVRHGETLTTYRSLAEIDSIIAKIEAEIAADAGQRRRRVNYFVQTGKGL